MRLYGDMSWSIQGYAIRYTTVCGIWVICHIWYAIVYCNIYSLQSTYHKMACESCSRLVLVSWIAGQRECLPLMEWSTSVWGFVNDFMFYFFPTFLLKMHPHSPSLSVSPSLCLFFICLSAPVLLFVLYASLTWYLAHWGLHSLTHLLPSPLFLSLRSLFPCSTSLPGSTASMFHSFYQ